MWFNKKDRIIPDKTLLVLELRERERMGQNEGKIAQQPWILHPAIKLFSFKLAVLLEEGE